MRHLLTPVREAARSALTAGRPTCRVVGERWSSSRVIARRSFVKLATESVRLVGEVG